MCKQSLLDYALVGTVKVKLALVPLEDATFPNAVLFFPRSDNNIPNSFESSICIYLFWSTKHRYGALDTDLTCS